MHTHTHIYTHMHTHTHTCTYPHIHICAHIYAHLQHIVGLQILGILKEYSDTLTTNLVIEINKETAIELGVKHNAFVVKCREVRPHPSMG